MNHCPRPSFGVVSTEPASGAQSVRPPGFDPLVGALARYVAELDARYPDGPQDLPCAIPAGGANMPAVLKIPQGRRP